MLVVGKHLLRKLEHKLVKAQVHFSFNLIIQELLTELGEGVVGTVIIQVQRIQHTPVRHVQITIRAPVPLTRSLIHEGKNTGIHTPTMYMCIVQYIDFSLSLT